MDFNYIGERTEKDIKDKIKLARRAGAVNVLVVCGGRSFEHDISILSAQIIAEASLDKYNIFVLYQGLDGDFYLMPRDMQVKDFKALRQATRVKFLTNSPFVYSEKGKQLFHADVAVVCAHGQNCEDGTLAHLFSLCGIACTSFNANSLAVTLDKEFMKDCFKAGGFKTPDYVALKADDVCELITLLNDSNSNSNSYSGAGDCGETCQSFANSLTETTECLRQTLGAFAKQEAHNSLNSVPHFENSPTQPESGTLTQNVKNSHSVTRKNESGRVILQKLKQIGFPLIIKPANLGSSIGVCVCERLSELPAALELASKYDSKIVCEKLLENFIEINCSARSEGNAVVASRCEEPVKHSKFLTFSDKYLSGEKGAKCGVAKLSPYANNPAFEPSSNRRINTLNETQNLSQKNEQTPPQTPLQRSAQPFGQIVKQKTAEVTPQNVGEANPQNTSEINPKSVAQTPPPDTAQSASNSPKTQKNTENNAKNVVFDENFKKNLETIIKMTHFLVSDESGIKQVEPPLDALKNVYNSVCNLWDDIDKNENLVAKINEANEREFVKLSVSSVPKSVIDEIKQTTCALYKKFDSTSAIRVDYLVDENYRVYVNEINSIPGSLAYYLWDEDVSQFVDKLILDAHKNFKLRAQKNYQFDTHL